METFSDTQRDFLARLAGEDFVDNIEKETADRQAELVGAGVDSKSQAADMEPGADEELAAVINIATGAEVETEPKTEPVMVTAEVEGEVESETPAEEEEPEEGDDPVEALRGDTEAAIKFLGQSMALQGETLKEIAGVMLKSEKTEEQKIAETIEMTPRASLLAIAQSAVTSDETKVDGRSTIAKSGPKETEALPPGGGTGVPLLDNIMASNQAHAERGRHRTPVFGK